MIMTAVGLTALVLTLPRTGGEPLRVRVPALIAFLAGMLALGVLLIAAPKLGTPAHHHGAVLGAAAGTLFGVADVALKALTTSTARSRCSLSPWLPVALLASVLAFLASARGFQEGEAVPVIACTSHRRQHHGDHRRDRRLRRRARRRRPARRPAPRLRARRRRRARHAARASGHRLAGTARRRCAAS